jgi:hypothetical protein
VQVNNPYTDMLMAMQRQGAKLNPPSIQIASVVASPPNLIIKIGELQIDKNNIYVADFLLSNYQREISIPESTATGTTSNGTIESVGIADVKMTSKDALSVGDSVAVMPTADRQTYIILCKVSKL